MDHGQRLLLLSLLLVMLVMLLLMLLMQLDNQVMDWTFQQVPVHGSPKSLSPGPSEQCHYH